jgi:hypothetical protein
MAFALGILQLKIGECVPLLDETGCLMLRREMDRRQGQSGPLRLKNLSGLLRSGRHIPPFVGRTYGRLASRAACSWPLCGPLTGLRSLAATTCQAGRHEPDDQDLQVEFAGFHASSIP